MLAVRVSRPPIPMVVSVLFSEMPVTLVAGTTVTSHVAVFAPSFVVTLIVAFSPMRVRAEGGTSMVPLAPGTGTATFQLELSHVTSLFVALLGSIVAIRVSWPPGAMFVLLLFRVTPVTLTASGSTVTVQEAGKLPCVVKTVIVAVPGMLPALMFPFWSTFMVMLLGTLDVTSHLRALFVAL